MDEIILTAEQTAEAERILDVVKGAAEVEIRQMARLLASKSNRELFGATEFRVTDGGNGLETCLVETVLPGLAREVVLILDFFHASEHLGEFAKLWEHDEDARHDQLATWCHALKHQGGTKLLAELESLDLTSRPSETHEAHRQLTNYVRNNQSAAADMNYPEYIARGWEIGSGEIESACKSVVNHRLKGPGMRWHLPGTTSLCQLRALYKSEPILWQTFWERTAGMTTRIA